MKNPSPVGAVKRGSPPSPLSINTYHLLYSVELEDLGRSHVIIDNGVITEIGSGWVNNPAYTVGVILPLPVNAHIHLNDYRIPEHHIGYDLGGYAGSKGLKHALIQLFKKPLLPTELLQTLIQYSIVIDFQEHSWICRRYGELLSSYGIEYIGLSRPRSWDLNEIEDVMRQCSGIGISNPTRIPPSIAPYLGNHSLKKLFAAHVSETKHMEDVGSLHYLLNYHIRLAHVVHGVFFEEWEYKLLGELGIPLVVNPRSNLWFTGRLPRIDHAIKHGVVLAMGTDNAGCFHPDIWVEAQILYTYNKWLEPRKILEMIVINGYKAVGKEPYIVEEDRKAYFLGADLGVANYRSGNIYASIINRITWSPQLIVFKDKKVFIINKNLNT